ncbi:MAG TPA: molybdate ABC transporter substrate-binding protein [Stellaceae bacterium]|jgi:molybdate transport system substrate-binding protein|nr:molybdate ABC transporter substrate-binding protein [Stellaceae bacterium]
MMKRVFWAGVVLLLLWARPAFADTLVFAAASLKNALDDAVAAYEKSGGEGVKVSYAASSALARQLDSGAPADIFISADLDWMDYAEKHGLIRPATRRNLLGNRLVLIAPKASAVAVEIKPGFPLAKLLDGNRLAVADPASVPAGKYAKAALEKLGVWASVEAKLAPAQDVRAALFLVARDEAPLGIVYATDAAAEPAVRIIAAFPADTVPPIVYPIALTAASKDAGAAKFLAFLESPAARPFFAKQGFTLLTP